MCAPIVFTAVSAGLQLMGGFAQASSIRAQGQAAQQYYEHNAKIAEQNALLAERTGRLQSRVIQDAQAIEGRKLKTGQAELRASQAAALAASGIPLSSVTAGDIERSTLSKQALDEASLRYNADARSWEALTGAQNQAYGLRTSAAGMRAAGQQARYASQISARNTLLGSFIGAGTSFLTPLTGSNYAIPGLGGYGIRTPLGTRNMGTYSLLPGR